VNTMAIFFSYLIDNHIFLSKSLMTRAHTFKYGEGVRGSNSVLACNFAMFLPTELNSWEIKNITDNHIDNRFIGIWWTVINLYRKICWICSHISWIFSFQSFFFTSKCYISNHWSLALDVWVLYHSNNLHWDIIKKFVWCQSN